MNDINLYEGVDSFKLLVDGVEYDVREPIGWDEFAYKFRRHPDYNGFINEYTDEDLMIKLDDFSGIEYVKAAYLTYGIDAEIYLIFGNGTGLSFEEIFRARVDLTEYSLQSEYLEVTLSSSTKREKIINRKLIKVDINGDKTLDNENMIALQENLYRFHSKLLQKKSVLLKSFDSTVIYNLGGVIFYIHPTTATLQVGYNFLYGTFGLDFIDIDELKEIYTSVEPALQLSSWLKELYIYKAKERGDHQIEIDINFIAELEQVIFIQSSNGDISESTYDCDTNLIQIDVILELGSDIYTIASFSTTDCADTVLNTGLQNINEARTAYLEQNETIKLYLKFTSERVLSNFNNITEIRYAQNNSLEVKQSSTVSITADTEARYSDVGAMLIHECMDKAVEAIMNEKTIFKSFFLGRTDLGYLNDGCGSKYALTNGKKIRQIAFADSHVQFTIDEAFKSLNAIFCIGMGIEYSDGIFYLTGEIFDGQYLSTTFLIPYYDLSTIQIYRSIGDDEFTLIGELSDVTLLSGSGTLADPFIYNGTPGSPIDPYSGLIKIVVSYLVGREIVRLEQKDYFYNDTLLFEIPAANIQKDSYEETPDLDITYNQLEIGYEKYPEDELNTLDEFNTKQEYATPIKSYRNKFEKLSKFIASGYAIEFQRRKTFENESDNRGSSPYDDDVFIIAMTTENYEVGIRKITNSEIIYLTQFLANPPAVGSTITVVGTTLNNGNYTVASIGEYGFLPKKTLITVVQSTLDEGFIADGYIKYEGGEYSPERNQPFESVTGVISPKSSYNLRISPKRMLYNWAKWINSGLFHKVGTDILKSTFTKSNLLLGGLVTQFKNTETCLLGDQDREVITEGADVALSDFNGFRKKFKPINIRFKARINYVDLKYILDKHQNESAESYGYIRFTDLEGNTRNGWLMELNYNPSLEIVEFKLREKA